MHLLNALNEVIKDNKKNKTRDLQIIICFINKLAYIIYAAQISKAMHIVKQLTKNLQPKK